MPAAELAQTALDFSSLYDAWFADVVRWARALGAADGDREDVAQEVFLVVRRKLAAFDGENIAGWLYRITQRTVSDYRRRAWFKNLFGKRRDDGLERLVSLGDNPEEALRKKDDAQTLYAILDTLPAKLRSAFVLYEIEGYACEEIAALEGITLANVWARVHRGRAKFFAELAERERKEVQS